MIKEFQNFPDRRHDLPRDGMSSRHLLATRDEHWKSMRNVLNPTFTSGKLKAMFPLITQSADTLVDNFAETAKSGDKFEAKQYFGAFTMDVIAATAFGLQIDSQKNKNDPFVRHAMETTRIRPWRPLIMASIFVPKLAQWMAKRGYTLLPKSSIKFFQGITKQAINNRSEDDQTRKDLLQLLIQAHIEDERIEQLIQEGDAMVQKDDMGWWHKKGLTTTEVMSNAQIFFIAGYDTTATALSFLSYNLALHPECQEKMYREIIEKIPNDIEMSYEQINELKYTEQCLLESMRIYPSVVRFARYCSKTTNISGIEIPKGVHVVVPVYAIHHDPEFWPEPEKFDPDRFQDKAQVDNSYTYLPFGGGPRVCIGKRLALLEAKCALAKVVRRYKFVVCNQTEIPLKLGKGNLTTTVNGIWLKMEERQ